MPDEFRKAVETSGIPVGLYIEGYLVDERSNIGKAEKQSWGLLNPDTKMLSLWQN